MPNETIHTNKWSHFKVVLIKSFFETMQPTNPYRQIDHLVNKRPGLYVYNCLNKSLYSFIKEIFKLF